MGSGPQDIPNISKDQIVEDLQAALYASKVVCYAQGVALIKAASDEKGWDINLAEELNRKQFAWRRIATLTVACGLGATALTSSLNYFDTYRRENLPANLTQAQRDFFGGNTYQRIDAEGSHHCTWTETHKSIGDVSERTAGNV